MKQAKPKRARASLIDRSPLSVNERKILERLRAIRREQEGKQNAK